VSLVDLSPDVIAVYLEDLELDERTRAVLDEAMALQREVAELRAEANAREQRIRAIAEDQSRIRANMDGLDRNSTLYRRYVADLEEQEGELDELEEELSGLRAQLQQAQRRL